MSEEKILRQLDAERAQLVERLGEFVSQESGTYDREDVEALGAVLRQHLARLDFDIEIVPQERFASHIIARRPSRNGKTLLLVGHFDTVWPHGTIRARPFRLENGRAYGPGTYDMKGGLVIMLAALAALRDAGSPTFYDAGITVFLNTDEEVFSPTSGPLIRTEAERVDTTCILEPPGPNGGYIFVRKAAGRYFLRVHGLASHAGRHPERGINANLELAHKLIRLQGLTDLDRGISVNVGVIRGGQRANVISSEAYAEVDVRAFAQDDMDRTLEQMRAVVAETVVRGARSELTGDLLFAPVVRRPVNERLFALVQEVAARVGFEAREYVSGGGSDASNTAQVVPTMDGMGPCGDGAHMDHEYVIVETLLERAKALALFLHRWPERIDRLARRSE